MMPGFKLLSFAAIAQEDEEHHFGGPFGPRTHVRMQGEALHPDREPLGLLKIIERQLGPEHFAGQYLQLPRAPGGNRVNIDWFGRYDPLTPPEFDYFIQSWDTASKASEISDYSVCTTWGVRDRTVYLLHVLRRKMEYPNLKRTVIEHARLQRANIILIESAASGISLAQDLRHDGVGGIIEVKPVGDKEMRLRMQSAVIEAGRVFLPHDAPWLALYIHELTTFPRGKHDDQVDSTTQALQWIFRATGMDGFLQLAAQHELKVEREKSATIWVNHPDKSLTLFLHGGKRAQREQDGSFAIKPEDVPTFRRISGIIFL